MGFRVYGLGLGFRAKPDLEEAKPKMPRRDCFLSSNIRVGIISSNVP